MNDIEKKICNCCGDESVTNDPTPIDSYICIECTYDIDRRKEIAKLEADLAAANERIAEMKEDIKSLNRSNLFQNEVNLNKSLKIAELERDLAAANDKYQELHAKYEELYVRNERHIEHLRDANDRVEGLQFVKKDLQTMQEDNDYLRGRIAELEKLEAGKVEKIMLLESEAEKRIVDIETAVGDIDFLIVKQPPAKLKEYINGLKTARKIILLYTKTGITKGECDV